MHTCIQPVMPVVEALGRACAFKTEDGPRAGCIILFQHRPLLFPSEAELQNLLNHFRRHVRALAQAGHAVLFELLGHAWDALA